MIDVGNFPRAIAMPGSGALQFPMPGTLLIGSPRSLAFLGQRGAACHFQVPIKGSFADRLDVLFQTGALVGHKDLASFLSFGASIQLLNGLVEETATFFASFGRSIATLGCFRQEPDVATTIGGLGIAQVGKPIANGTRRRARIDLPLLFLVGFYQSIPLVGYLEGFWSGRSQESMDFCGENHRYTLRRVSHLNFMRVNQ